VIADKLNHTRASLAAYFNRKARSCQCILKKHRKNELIEGKVIDTPENPGTFA
jgi:hypothetical protein